MAEETVVTMRSGYYVKGAYQGNSFFTTIKPLGEGKGFQLLAPSGEIVGTAETIQDAVDRACLLHRLGVVKETKKL
jgi:hypothetical protein